MTTRDTDWDGVRLHVVTGKGGTGKTTTVRTLTDIFRRAGLRTLAVDLDPQGNLSDYFDIDPEAEPTIADVLNGTATAADAMVVCGELHAMSVPGDSLAWVNGGEVLGQQVLAELVAEGRGTGVGVVLGSTAGADEPRSGRDPSPSAAGTRRALIVCGLPGGGVAGYIDAEVGHDVLDPHLGQRRLQPAHDLVAASDRAAGRRVVELGAVAEDRPQKRPVAPVATPCVVV